MGVAAFSNVTIVDSLFQETEAGQGGALGIAFASRFTIINSTFDSTSAISYVSTSFIPVRMMSHDTTGRRGRVGS